MKKTYIIPEMSVVATEPESMIADSARIDNGITVGQGSELGREEEDFGGSWDAEW